MKVHKETKEFFHNYLFFSGVIGLIISILLWNLAPVLIFLMFPIPLALAYEIGTRMRKKKKKKKRNK